MTETTEKREKRKLISMQKTDILVVHINPNFLKKRQKSILIL